MNKEKIAISAGILIGSVLLYKGLWRTIVTYLYNSMKGGG